MQILGCSESAVIVIVDALYSNCYTGQVDLIKNIPSDGDLRGQPIEIQSFFHDEYEYKDLTAVLGVWRTKVKRKVFEFFRDKYYVKRESYMNLIHANATLPECKTFGIGINIGPNSVLAPLVHLEDFVTLNRQVSVGHHTKICEFTTVNPGVNIAGNCLIGKNVTIGIGANIVDGIEIGDNTIIGAGALVTKSIPANVVAYGVPAKTIR